MESFAFLRPDREGTLITLHVQPKASKNALAGIHESVLKLRLTAPPVEGAANKECVKFLAKLFGIAKSAVEIQQGLKSRHKTVLIKGLQVQDIARVLRRHGIE